MSRKFISLFVSLFSVSLVLFPFLKAGSNGTGSSLLDRPISDTFLTESASSSSAIINMGAVLYDSMNLGEIGLSEEAFEYAYKGFQKLKEEGLINRDVITICDFSQSSRKKRLYLIDLDNFKLLMNTYVAHGRNSGGEFATSFSNNPESLQSSLGFYVTLQTYYGEHGLALKIKGLEKGFNDKADSRCIVVHGSEYVGNNYLRNNKYMGRSWGCPAVPAAQTNQIINNIKNGTCLFIYHPTQKYLHGSNLLNG